MEFFMNYGLWIILGVCVAGAFLTLLIMSWYNRYKMIRKELKEAMAKGKPGSEQRKAWEEAHREEAPEEEKTEDK